MVDKDVEQAVDESISETEKLLTEMPETVRKRTIEVKAYPSEVVSRIKQINGVFVEFEERV